MSTPLHSTAQAKDEMMWRHDGYRVFAPGLRPLVQHAAEFLLRGFDTAKNCLAPWFAGREAELATLVFLVSDPARR